jgi:hypothetical protein
MRARPLAAAATLAAAGAVTAAATAPADPGPAHAAAAQKITSSRVGGVFLGDRYHLLRTAGLVGRIGPGCELAENTRSADLKAPLKGSVNFTQSHTRRVTDILVRGGAKARGVGVGARQSAVLHAFPRAVVDHSTDHVFGITLVRVPKRGPGDRLQFAVSTKTHRVTLIGLPIIAFCE